MNDDLGDRMKMYEGIEAGRRFMPLLPVVARLDGRGFSKFTKGLARPYDTSMSRVMIATTEYLVRETGASIGYTQSDEISLAWHSTNVKSQIFFDGRISKMTSQLAALATLKFYTLVQQFLGDEYAEKMPTFDTRVWSLPNRKEAVNVFVWREWDATKNSISMAASHCYPHSELVGKSGAEKQDMLNIKGINWDNYPSFFKRGTYVQRKTEFRHFTPEEISNLPEKHIARNSPDFTYVRKIVEPIELGVLTTVENQEGVIFDGQKPVYKIPTQKHT